MAIRDLLGSRRALAYGVAMLATYGLLIIAGATGSVAFFAFAAVLASAAEVAVRFSNGVLQLLGRLQVTPVHRHLARDAAVLVFLLSQPDLAPSVTVVVALLLAVVWTLAVGSGAASVVVRRSLIPPVETRNIDLSGLPLPAGPPRVVMALAGDRLPYLNVLIMLTALGAAVADTAVPVIAGAAAAVTGAAAVALGIGPALVRAWRAPSRQTVLEVLRSRAQPAPMVLLHFAGPGKDAYQVNMWLRTVEALDEPALVLLRERSCFPALAETSLPVLCITNPVDVINFGFDNALVALHPSNVGKNIHILREPGMKHVFVGHGDSDKVASINPYSKVYDEIWVAGRAGRERYAIADVGVRDEDIVEVGRPQLAGITADRTSARTDSYTVLYAPTWEGWVEDPHATSLLLLGERIISGLLAASPAVRVWYKPHPLTGTRSQAVASVHRRLVELVAGAGGRAGPASSADLPGLGHQAFTGPEPELYACFNHADLLVSDISSVVSDWVASRKPYVVGNTMDVPDDEFRRLYPTARGAYLLGSNGAELEKIVQVTRSGDDPMARDRDELKEYLLGPDEPSALDRFRGEVTRLCDRARDRGSDRSRSVQPG